MRRILFAREECRGGGTGGEVRKGVCGGVRGFGGIGGGVRERLCGGVRGVEGGGGFSGEVSVRFSVGRYSTSLGLWLEVIVVAWQMEKLSSRLRSRNSVALLSR
jgi:hypothetical protein